VRKSIPFLSLPLLLLTLHPVALVWAAWVAFVPLLFFIRSEPRPIRDSLIGFGIGLLYYAVFHYWVFYYEGAIFFKVVPLSALPWGIFAGLVSSFSRSLASRESLPANLAQIFLPPSLWVLLMLPFNFSPVGALPLEIPFYQPLPLLQLAALGGMPLLSFLILSMNSALALSLGKRRKEAAVTIALLSGLILSGTAWGFWRLSQPLSGETPVALIQTNLPISESWREEHIDLIREKYAAWAGEAARAKPALIIFPQYNLLYDAYREPEHFNRLARETGAFLLLGTYTPGEAELPPETAGQYNIALAFSPERGLAGEYRATEGPPFRRIGQLFGTELNPIETPAGRMGILLCFEDAIPSVSKAWVRKGADFLVVLSNTGHFTETIVPHYHLLQDQLRAIETGRPLVRVTPNGYSAVIDPQGRFRTLSRLGKEQILLSKI
jgi:apolipoprotein N-acyltransferase